MVQYTLIEDGKMIERLRLEYYASALDDNAWDNFSWLDGYQFTMGREDGIRYGYSADECQSESFEYNGKMYVKRWIAISRTDSPNRSLAKYDDQYFLIEEGADV